MSRNLNTRTVFQCYACKARTKQGDFNEVDLFECFACFNIRKAKYERLKVEAMQHRKTPFSTASPA